MTNIALCKQDQARLDPLTRRIIGCIYTVANSLGSGFLEKVYENALAHELQKRGIALEQQKGVRIFTMASWSANVWRISASRSQSSSS